MQNLGGFLYYFCILHCLFSRFFLFVFFCLFVCFFCAGLGERILREDKEMREMKRRLMAIEADLQALYRDNNDESEVNSGFLTHLIIFC